MAHSPDQIVIRAIKQQDDCIFSSLFINYFCLCYHCVINAFDESGSKCVIRVAAVYHRRIMYYLLQKG